MPAKSPLISIITPAYGAEQTLAGAVKSAVAQTHENWEMLIIADDGVDYQATLADQGVVDPRMKFLSTGQIGSGAAHTRNLGLDAAAGEIIAILDADDRLHTDKFALALEHIGETGLVTTAIRAVLPDGTYLRDVAAGPDRLLDPAAYKFINISMDSMLLYDRAKADPRYDAQMQRLSDIELVLQIFATIPAAFHIGTPLHDYVKQPSSLTNAAGATQKIIDAKLTLIARLSSDHYPLAGGGVEGLLRFYEASLRAEQAIDAARETDPDLLFEDHLERFLPAAAT